MLPLARRKAQIFDGKLHRHSQDVNAAQTKLNSHSRITSIEFNAILGAYRYSLNMRLLRLAFALHKT